jgi:hypothetical protein
LKPVASVLFCTARDLKFKKKKKGRIEIGEQEICDVNEEGQYPVCLLAACCMLGARQMFPLRKWQFHT